MQVNVKLVSYTSWDILWAEIQRHWFLSQNGSFDIMTRPALANLWHACPKWHAASSTHCSPNIFISFVPPPSLYCAKYVYIHTYLTAQRLYMSYRCYQITLQWYIFTQIGAVRSVDWIFIVRAVAWRWLGEYVALDRAFYSIFLVTGRIRDIGQNVSQISFGNWANKWH